MNTIRILAVFLFALVSGVGIRPSAAQSVLPSIPGLPAASQDYTPDELLIRLKTPQGGPAAPSSLDSLNDQFGVQQVEPLFPAGPALAQADSRLANIYLLHLAPGTDVLSAASAYRQDPNVLYAEPNFIYHLADTIPNDLDFPAYQWNLHNTGQTGGTPGADLDMLKAWDIQTGNSSVVIAIIDTGVDYNHFDLAGKIWQNLGEISGNGLDDDANGFIDDVRGWDFVTAPSYSVAPGEDYAPPDNDPMDFNGHGTAMSGIAAALTYNYFGMAGICWGCKIMPLRAGYSSVNGGGSLDQADIDQAIVYAVNNGASVISMSFGGYYDADTMRTVVAYAEDHSVVMTAAAGNSGSDYEFYPAAYPEVFAVAATDANDQRSIWGEQSSNVGFWVDAAAPGTQIRGTWPGGGFVNMDGTSPAAPHAAGLAGLLLSQHPVWTSAQVRTALESSVDPIDTDEYIGAGRINAWNALNIYAVPDLQISDPFVNAIITTITPVLGTASGGDFQSYVLEAGSGDYPAAWTTIASSSQPVTRGSLGTWDPAGLPSGVAILRLRVTGVSGSVTHTQIRVLVDHRLMPGWPKAISAYPPILVDINDDGTDEVLLGSLDGWVHILDGGGNELAGWPKKIGETLAGSPAAGDLDGDHVVEIVAASRNTTIESLHVWHTDGSLLPGWPLTWNGEVLTGFAIGDVDAQGSAELVGMTTNESGAGPAKVHIWSASAAELPGWPFSLPLTPGGFGENATDPCLGDLNSDGQLEIVFGDANGYMHVLKLDRTELAGWPRMASPDTLNSRYSNAALGDVDGDGVLEVATTSNSFEARIWKANGDLMPGWPQWIPYYALSRPILADLDSDGKLELLLHSNIDRIYAWREDGSLLSGYPVELRKQYYNGAYSPLIAADVTGDRRVDVLASGDERRVQGWDGSGQELPGGPYNMAFTSYGSAAVGDIDGDGKLDLVGADTHKVYAWRTSAPDAPWRVQWGMINHDPQHTGRIDLPVVYFYNLPLMAK